MIRVRLQVVIARPAAEVFAYTADLEKMPEWAAGPVRCEQTSAGPRDVGTTYRITAKPPVGPPMRSEYVLTAYVENQRFAGDGAFGPIPFSEVYRFTDVAAGTRIDYGVEMRPHGWLRLLEPALRLGIPLLLRSDLRRLKRRLESRASDAGRPS